ncbi:DUF6483 family protein [Xylocopilactobacillus apis]|uniref:Uncharacterized protein n=1 Tax=Xylocopilactobacillus apis TaxID=2932183 RepID=A0AAU9DRE3_9LACO|nr:DUF6483 family protein [Xylocopilactobacillus apis]BDR56223.1 hypothetical protein KIMC2_07850 [Xylocopilactobacillus apis]
MQLGTGFSFHQIKPFIQDVIFFIDNSIRKDNLVNSSSNLVSDLEREINYLLEKHLYKKAVKKLFYFRYDKKEDGFTQIGFKLFDHLKSKDPIDLENGGLSLDDLDRGLNRLKLIAEGKI